MIPPQDRNSAHHSFLTLAALLGLILTACQASITSPPTPFSPSLSPQPSTLAPTDTPTDVPESFPGELPTITATPIPRHTPTLTLTPKAPQFSLLSRPDSVFTAWRPPVYPVPWAPNPYDHFYFYRPVKASDIEYPTPNYGYGNVFFDDVVHTGIDIPGDIGTPILAAGDGKVIWTGYGYYRQSSDIYADPYGKAVAIKHRFGYKNQTLITAYAHLEEITVQYGQYVEAGDQIGLMGETGHTTGPHLHFEVRLGEDDYFTTRNPYLWLVPPQGWGLLVGQVRNWNGKPLQNQRIYLHSSTDPQEQHTEKDRIWIAETYTNQAINQDPHYQENLVISDLPAGTYQINIPMTDIGRVWTQEVEIRPGEVTYFTFQLWDGFTVNRLPTPDVNFSPAP